MIAAYLTPTSKGQMWGIHPPIVFCLQAATAKSEFHQQYHFHTSNENVPLAVSRICGFIWKRLICTDPLDDSFPGDTLSGV
jgi:hypothetical protein